MEVSKSCSYVVIAVGTVDTEVDVTINCGLKSTSIKPVTGSVTGVAINNRDFWKFTILCFIFFKHFKAMNKKKKVNSKKILRETIQI